MITVNGKVFDIKHFPDNTQCLMNFDINYGVDNYIISWRYECDEELVTLMYIVNHIRNKRGNNIYIDLLLPYIPNARMDRVKHDSEVFTLKYFSDFINSLKFEHVYSLDVHSDVACALINNLVHIPVNYYIEKAVSSIVSNYGGDNIMIYFPDAGAYKRYKDIDCISKYPKIYGKKVRNWETGKIEGLKIVDKNDERMDLINPKPLEGKVIIMIDDIISYGGTMYYSAAELNRLGTEEIYAYATHVEAASLWNEDAGTFKKALGFENKTVNIERLVTALYTTNSLYSLESGNRVYVIPINNFLK